MSIETLIHDALGGLVSGRVYPDTAPEKIERPYITYQQVGGEPINFLDSGTAPSQRNARIQVNVWAERRAQANALAIAVEDALRASTALQTTVLGCFAATTDDAVKLRGTMQDFSVWG